MNYLILPHIKIHNANALSSPFTIGFPAMSAWLGVVHLMQRRVSQEFDNIEFSSVGVVSHKANLHIFRDKGDYVSSIIGTSNPLDKDGKRPSFIEEPRIDLEVSLVVEIKESLSSNKSNRLATYIKDIMNSGLKVASGDILSFKTPKIKPIKSPKDLIKYVGIGYALIQRRDLMLEQMREGKDALEALVDLTAVHYKCEMENEKALWQSSRKSDGWIVPISIGFMGISELGKAKNQRDKETLHRFAESVVTIGEFRMPHRLDTLDDMMWEYRYDAKKSLYLCETKSTKE